MRAILILAALGWAASSPWTETLLVIALIGTATIAAWWLNAMPQVGERFRGSSRGDIDPAYVSALESIASEAEAEVEKLRAEVNRLRAPSDEETDAATISLYRKVGLSPAAPAWLIEAAPQSISRRSSPRSSSASAQRRG